MRAHLYWLTQCQPPLDVLLDKALGIIKFGEVTRVEPLMMQAVSSSYESLVHLPSAWASGKRGPSLELSAADSGA